jgi:hypothetical protein
MILRPTSSAMRDKLAACRADFDLPYELASESSRERFIRTVPNPYLAGLQNE